MQQSVELDEAIDSYRRCSGSLRRQSGRRKFIVYQGQTCELRAPERVY